MVSVIIPIYNVLRFIERGINQILQQTYSDYEIILVDDGSTDGSYEKCRQLAIMNDHIRVLHQENQGAGGARNLGLESAKGDFIYFFDIDDVVSPKLLEYNVGVMEKENVDMVVFGYKNIETTFKSEITVAFSEKLIVSNSQLRDVYVDNFVMKTNGFPWNKFYRKSFLDKFHLRFEDQRIQQDEVFNLKCYRHLDRMYISSEVFYTYFIYEKGNTRSGFIPNRFDIYKSVRLHFESLKDYWHLSDRRFDNYLENRFYESTLSCLLFNLNHPKCIWDKQTKKRELNRVMCDLMTIRAFEYADNNYRSIEHKLYRKACRERSLCKIKFYSFFFSFLHIVRKKMK